MIRRLSLVVFVALVACHAPRPDSHTAATPPPHGRPGDVLRAEAFSGAPSNARAFRIRYSSTAPGGALIVVSALVIVPSVVPPADGRPVLAWLHPTTGVAQACAPSLGPNPFGQIQGLSAFLAAGYMVVA